MFVWNWRYCLSSVCAEKSDVLQAPNPQSELAPERAWKCSAVWWLFCSIYKKRLMNPVDSLGQPRSLKKSIEVYSIEVVAHSNK